MKINVIKRLESLKDTVMSFIETTSSNLDFQNERIEKFEEDMSGGFVDLENRILDDVQRIEDIANFKEHRFTKPVNEIIGVPPNTDEIYVGIDFHPDIMEVRLNGRSLVHKSHSSDRYDYYYENGYVILNRTFPEEMTLWIRSEVTLDIKMSIEREYIYEEYENSYGKIQKRLAREEWVGDIVKTILYLYEDEQFPYRVTKEKVLRDNKEYVREYEYTEYGIKTKSTEGLEDYFVQRIMGGEDFTRTEVRVTNMTEAIITHNLGYKFPFVQVWDDGYLCTCVVETLDHNKIKVSTYDNPINGVVIVRK